MPLTNRVLAPQGAEDTKLQEGTPVDILHKVHSMQLARGLHPFWLFFFFFLQNSEKKKKKF